MSESLTEKAAGTKDPKEYAARYLEYLAALLQRLDTAEIARMIQAFEKACKESKTVYLIGNGGSAATATHWQNDILLGTRADGKMPFKAVSLCDNNAVLTCVGNDEGFDRIFEAQLEPVLQEGDVVVAFSVSGTSPNIVRAIEFSKSRGAVTIGFTGFDGGELVKQCDICLHVPAPRPEYGPVEDVFQIVDHLMTAYFRVTRLGHL